ncbi:D-lactate dehydrogenase [Neofusicoccum parvum]|nr:D-lactate dehydrogenase [Neofusicoccum parvum]
MSGTIIVTGAAGGLGFAISETIIHRAEPYTLIFTVRDKNATNAKPLDDLIESSAGDRHAQLAELDLSKFESIRAFAANINSRVASGELPPIRGLILNAAYVPVGPERRYTSFSKDGEKLEMNFAVNHLANVQLSLLLLRSMDKHNGRIVYVSSMESDSAKSRFSPEKLSWDPEEFAFAKQEPQAGDEANDAMRRYGVAKLCQVMFMFQLQKRLDSAPGLDKLCIIGVDPGAMVHANMISKYSKSPFVKYIVGPGFMGYTRAAQHVWPNGTFRTVKKSATDVVRAALGLDNLGGYPKGVYMNGSEHGEAAAESKDEKKQGEVWELSLKLAKLRFLPVSALKPHTATTQAGKPAYASKKQMEKAIEELRTLLGEDAISTDPDDLHRHGYSDWSTTNVDQLPIAVAYPRSTEEVSQIAKACYKYKIPIIPFSGGTSVEGQFTAPYGGFSIDFAHMDKIIAIHDNDLDVVVQPAVPWMELNEKIKDAGLFFPVDPGPGARIGGMVGTSCSGTNAVRYGTMKDWVVNLTVVLADGRIIKTRRRPRKTAAGYNLTNLFVGAEGTLGLVTEATLKLTVLPQETSVAVVSFPSIGAAAKAASAVMRAGVPVAAMEIMDDVQMGVINRVGSTTRRWAETTTVFFKFSGNRAGVRENIETVQQIARANRCGEFMFAADEAEQRELWSARKEALWSMLALKGEDEEIWSTDVAVPLSRLAEIIEDSKKELSELGMFASMLGHVGDGNFHSAIFYNKKDPEQVEKVKRVVYRMVDKALEMEGTCTGEHSVGLSKKASLMKELGPETIGVMRDLKRALDPYSLMNPGKIFDV